MHRASAASRRVPLILAIEKSMQPIFFFKMPSHAEIPRAPAGSAVSTAPAHDDEHNRAQGMVRSRILMDDMVAVLERICWP